jgi:hypothetical protein
MYTNPTQFPIVDPCQISSNITLTSNNLKEVKTFKKEGKRNLALFSSLLNDDKSEALSRLELNISYY